MPTPAHALLRRFALPMAAALVLLTAAGSPVTAADYFYTYAKQPLHLGLDASRIAVFKEEAGQRPSTERAAPPSLDRFGIADRSMAPHAVKGWSLATLDAAERAAGDIEALVAQVAADNTIDFVSPVYLDRWAMPYIVTRDILVGFPDDTIATKALEVLREHDAGVVLASDFAGQKNVYRVRTNLKNGVEVLNLANALADRPDVKFAEPDALMTVRYDLTPNDPTYTSQWGLHNTGQSGGTVDMDIDAPEAWNISIGVPTIKVAVLDDGVDETHVDINQLAGMDFSGQATAGAPGNQCDNHGTAVAGCIAATINNSLGVTGVSPGCKVISLKTSISNVPCNGAGTFQPSWIADALNWSVDNGVRVTNTSSGFGESSVITGAYNGSQLAGLCNFVSAGNSGVLGVEYPANLASVNCVGAINRNGNRASFSTFGPELEFVAPGQSINTTDRTGTAGYGGTNFTVVDGTSFSSPYAAGVAALILSVRSDLTSFSVTAIMKQTAVDRGTAGFDTQFGWGIVNAFAAMTLAPSYVPPVPGAFNLLLPANGASGVALNPLLDWSVSSGVSSYTVTLADNPAFTNPLFSFPVNISQLQLSNGSLQPDTTYYWKVVALNEFGPTYPSPTVFSFNTNTAPPPGCAGDANGDGDTNSADLSVLLGQFGSSVPVGTGADYNDDGLVNAADLSVLLGDFGCVN